MKRPYPRTPEKVEVLTAFGYGAFTAVFLALFDPFQFGEAGAAVVYGGIVTVCLLFMRLPPLIFKRAYDERRWTVGREIISDAVAFAVVGTGVCLYTAVRYGRQGGYLTLIGMVVAIGLIPYVVSVLLKENRLLKKYRLAADTIQKELAAPPVLQPVTGLVLLRSENPSENLEMTPDDLVCIEASDNYIRVFRASTPPVLLRSALKRAEEDLKGHPGFFRCHRGYIVNLSKVVLVTGNAQGLKLHLASGQVVPVSRGLTADIRQLLKKT
ncbi:LytR/AlgR family response regulator transcription factor [Dinghuibacter silviterrae]|uniref:LytTR family transcriptional regulator n=1 Tax=Dinghuibacter silviterrae TaxID=1539049 RepID=A0A4R8DI75_9BACT|nr:LytTR family DNA-binding domain-containing protein [Dinghuibacter silviterrae]TDW97178.1 LytTR family transcriptional regulator [Dinghuibacter silviterrae]